MDPMGTFELKSPKAGIVLRWVTFPALDTRCTLPLWSTQSLWDYLGEPDIANQPPEPTMWEPRVMSMEEIRCRQVWASLSVPIQGVHL